MTEHRSLNYPKVDPNVRKTSVPDRLAALVTKEKISHDYMEQMKILHAWKPLASQRRALIVGARAGNIGMAISDQLFENGMIVMPVDKDQVDVCQLSDKFTELAEVCDVLVLSNGVMKSAWFEDFKNEDIELIFDTNIVGSLKAARDFVKLTMQKDYKKYIVFVGSMAHRCVLNGSVAYCASKAALAQATRCLAWELAPKGFNVFCVHPSNTEGTPMTERTIQGLMEFRGLSRAEATSYWGAVLPKAKWLQPDDVAETVAFLVSGKADYLSGANLDMAGGQR